MFIKAGVEDYNKKRGLEAHRREGDGFLRREAWPRERESSEEKMRFCVLCVRKLNIISP